MAEVSEELDSLSFTINYFDKKSGGRGVCGRKRQTTVKSTSCYLHKCERPSSSFHSNVEFLVRHSFNRSLGKTETSSVSVRKWFQNGLSIETEVWVPPQISCVLSKLWLEELQRWCFYAEVWVDVMGSEQHKLLGNWALDSIIVKLLLM